MRRTTKLVISATLGILAWASATSSQAALISYSPGIPRIPAARISQPPVIDGKLDDTCWSKAGESSNFASYSGNGLAKDQTTVYLAYDKSKLYVGFRCKEPNLQKLVTKATKRDENTWEDDSVELFLDTGRDRENYFHFVVNAAGVQYDAEQGEGKLAWNWNGSWESKTAQGTNEWTCEIAVPFIELKSGSPKPGTIWTFNAARNQRTTPEESNWAGVVGKAHQPKNFGELIFTDQPIGVCSKSLGSMFYGDNAVQVDVFNYSAFTQVVNLRIDVASDDDLKDRIQQRIMLAKGERREISTYYPIHDGDYLIVELRDGELGEIYQRERYTLHLPSPRLSEIKSRINQLDNARKLVGKRNTKLTQQLDLVSTGIRQNLDKLQGTIDGYMKAKATLETDNWSKMKRELDLYCDKIHSYADIVWTRNPWQTAMPEDLPESGTSISELNVNMCVDEYESAVFQITNLHETDFNGRLVVSDLVENTKRAGARKQLGKDHIVVRNVEYRTQRSGAVIPDILPRANELNEVRVPSGETTQVWLTLDSKDAVPGSYTGTITIKPFDRKAQSKTVRLNVTILPIKLPEKMPISTYNWDYAGDETYINDLADHRVNTFLLAIPLPELDKEGNLIKSGDYNSAQLQMKRDYGHLMYSYGIIESYNEYVNSHFDWKFMDEKWKKGFRTWITDWMDALKQIGLGYNDFSIQLWDEASEGEVDQVVQAGAFLREIDPNIRTVMDPDGRATLEDMKKMAPYVDLWIPINDHLNKDTCQNSDQELEFLKSTGKPIWSYTCNIDMPALSPMDYYRLKPWRTWSLGLDGCAFWAYNSFRDDAWDDFDGPANMSDNGVIYPGDKGPITSRRWEAYREGLEDYLYLYLLNAAIAKGKTQRIDMNALLAAQDTLNKTVPDVLTNAAKDPMVVDSARDQIARNLLNLNRIMTFQAKAPTADPHDADVIVRWDTSEPCVGTVYYRKQGATTWRAVTNLTPDTNHAITLSNIRSGVVYEYFTESVNDIGYIQVDDNESAYYTCKR